MEYGDVLWDGCTDGESDLLEFVQYEAAKIVTGAMFVPLIIIYLKLGVNHLPNVFVALKLKVLIITFYIVRCLLLHARLILLSSAAYIFAHMWYAMTETPLISVFLSGSSQISEEESAYIFYYVQSFIKETGRFTHVEP
jgi:hypothetical protein